MGLNYRFYSQQDGGGSPSSSLAGRKQFESGLVQVVEDFNKAYFAANPGIDPAKFWPMENKTGSDGVNRIRQLADAILGGGRQNVSQSLKDVGAKGTIAYPMGSTDTETIQYYSLLFERVGTWLSTWGIDTDKSNGRSAQTTRSQDGQTMYVWFGLVQSHALIASAISRNASQSHSTSTSIMSDAGGEKTTSAPGALSPKEKEDLLGQFETRLTYEIAVIVNSARDTKRVGETYTLRESSSNSDMIPFLRTSFVDRVLRTDFRVDPTVLSVSMNLDPGAPDTTVADYLLTANRNGGVLAGICDHYARFLGCTREELFTLTRTANAFGRITISLSLNVSREEMEGLIVTAMSKPALASDDAKTSQRARREKKIESESTQIGTSPQLQTQTTKTEKRTVDDNLARGETKKTTKTAAEGGKTASDKPAAGKTSGNNESANINEQVAGGIIVGALASTNTGLDLLGKYFNFDDMVTFSSIVARMRNSYTQAQTDINSLYLNDAETGNRKLIELQEKIKEAFREKSISYSMLVGTSLEAGLIDKFGEDVETAFRSLADFENKLNAYMDLQSATSPDPAKTSAAQADLDAAKVALQQSLSKNRIGFQYVLGARYGPKLEGLSEVADILGITLTPDPDIANEFSVFIGRMFAPSAWQKAQMALSVLNHYPKTKEKLRIDQGAEVQTIKFSDGTFKDRIAIDPFSQIRFADMLSKNAAPASMTDEQLVPLVTAAKYMPAGTAGVILSSGAFLSYLAQFSSDQKTVGTIFNYASQKLSKVYARMPNGQKLAKMKEMMDGLKNLDVAGNLLSTIKQNYVSTNNKEINADMRIGNIFQIQLPYLMGRLVDPKSIALEPTPLFPSNYVPEVYEYSVPERPRTIEQFNLSKYKLNQYENTQPGTDYYVYRYAERQFGYAPGYMDVVNAIEKEYLRVIGSTFDTTRGLHLESLDNLGSSRPGAWAEKLDAYLKGDNGGQLGGYLYRRKEWGQTESSQTSAYLQGSDLRTILPWVEEKVNLLDLMAYYRTVDWGNLSNLEVKNDELRSTLNAQAQTAGSLVLNVFGTQTHSLSASGYESIAPRLDSQVYYLSSDGKWYAVGDLKIRNLNDQSLNSVLRNQEFGEIFANPGNDLRMDAAAMNSFIQHEGQDKKNGQALLLAIQPWSPVVVGGFSTLSQDYGVFGGTEITSADQKYIVDGGFVSFNYSALMSQGGMLGLNSLTNYYHAHDYDIRIPLKPEDVDRRLNVAKLAVLAYGEWEAQILGGWKSDRNLAATGGGVAGFRVAGTEGHVEAYADFDKGIKLSNIQEKTNEAYASAGGRLGAENKAGETNVLGYGANTRFWNEAGGALSVRLYDRGKGLKESGILTITGSNRQFAQAPVDIFAQGLVPQMKSFNEELNGPNPDYKDLGNKAAYINNWIFGTLPGISALSLPFGNNFSASYRGDDGGWKLSALNSKDGTWGTGIVTSGSFSFYGGGLLDNKGQPVSQSSELHYFGGFRVGKTENVFSVYLTKLRDDRAPAVIYSAGIGDFGMTTGAKTDASLWFAHIQAPAPAIPLNVLFNIAGTKEGYYAAEAGLVGNILGDFSVSGAYQKTYAQKGLFNQDRIATEINYNGKDYIIGGSYQLVGTKGYGSQSYYYLTVKHKL